MANSKIEWTDRSDWNPIRGCTRVSPGCGGPNHEGGCYAEKMAARFSDAGAWGHGYAERTKTGGRWTGTVAVQWDRMDLPLRWRVPAKIFASSTSDWFHEKLPATEIASLMAVAVAAVHLRGHTVQILTKRADRMRKVMTSSEFWDQVNAEAEMHVMDRIDPLARRSDDARATLQEYGPGRPPPGVWLGVSVEDQQRADERVPQLLATPAAMRFLSCEPLLERIDIRRYLDGHEEHGVDLSREVGSKVGACVGWTPPVDWVIAGGESGPRRRPIDPDWLRALRDQCAAASVPFFAKQLDKVKPLPADMLVQQFPEESRCS